MGTLNFIFVVLCGIFGRKKWEMAEVRMKTMHVGMTVPFPPWPEEGLLECDKGEMRPVWIPAASSLATRYEKEEAWHCERRYLWR